MGDQYTDEFQRLWLASQGAKVAKSAKGLKVEVDKLRELVATVIAEDPLVFDGHTWAARSQSWWYEKLGVSPATLRRYISKPPFQREAKMVSGRKAMLLREGVPGPVTRRKIAKALAKIWDNKLNRGHTHDEFGELNGLAQDWGLDLAPKVFKFVLENWPAFMSGVFVRIGLGQEIPRGRRQHHHPAKLHRYKCLRSKTRRILPVHLCDEAGKGRGNRFSGWKYLMLSDAQGVLRAKSAKNSEPGATPVMGNLSRARVQAT